MYLSILTFFVDDSALNCQLESLSIVDVWSANHFCSIGGFFFISLLSAKAFLFPRQSRGLPLVLPMQPSIATRDGRFFAAYNATMKNR